MFLKNQECSNYKFCAPFCPHVLKSFAKAVDISDFGPLWWWCACFGQWNDV